MHKPFIVPAVAVVVALVLCGTVVSDPPRSVQEQQYQIRVQPGAGAPQRMPVRAGASREPFLSALDFGATTNDERPDDAAIQRAIDALPRPPVPNGREVCGGVIAIPSGRYKLTKALRIPNGVVLRGEGAATVLHAIGDDPAVLLVCPFTHGHIASAVVEDLSIYTEKSHAITVDPSASNVVQCRFENLILSPAGVGIHLDPPNLPRRTYVQNTLVRNVHVAHYGASALTLWGNANHVEQVNTEGGTRRGFQAEPAIVSVGGAYNDIRSCVIEGNGPNAATAFHVSGNFTWSHNWAEVGPAKDGVAYVFSDAEIGHIDYLHHILPWHKAKFVNCQSLLIRSLNLDGELSSLSQNIDLDESSNLRIDHVIARTDAGMLDDPRVSIGSVYNKIGKYRIDLPLRGTPTKLLSAVPGAAAQPSVTDGWTARWDTPQGLIKGTIRLETAPSAPSTTTRPSDANGAGSFPRLRVEVTENPNKVPLGVEKHIDPPAELLGKRCVVTWRVEGPGQTLVNYYGQQIPSRAMGSLTANLLSVPAKRGDVLQFVIPPEPGVYYISDVALYPR